jgi:hypothetical protein
LTSTNWEKNISSSCIAAQVLARKIVKQIQEDRRFRDLNLLEDLAADNGASLGTDPADSDSELQQKLDINAVLARKRMAQVRIKKS